MTANLISRIVARLKKLFWHQPVKIAPKKISAGKSKVPIKREPEYKVLSIGGEVGILDITES